MYSMNDSSNVARQATEDIELWLQSFSRVVSVVNVENDPTYQKLDIDLLVTTDRGLTKVEIKGDRYHKTGNLFFETHSNKEKGTPGCFMYTEANWVLYYFVTPRTLYMLPMPATREWFAANIDRFRERSTTTKVGNGFYTTVGRLVPITVVRQEVEGVRKFNL